MKPIALFSILLPALVLQVCPVWAADAGNYESVFRSFELDNNYGKRISLRDFSKKPIVVLAFLGTECPLAKLYGPKLDALHDRFSGQGVVFLGISSNKQDSLTELTAYVHRYEIGFPVLKDLGNHLADALNATRTPEVFVFDSRRELRYRGRIDDQYGVGYSRDDTGSADLSRAIEELLANKPVSVPETKAIGCIIGRVKELEPSGEITYSKDIAPILNSHCVSCHREGEIGPFTLTCYNDVLGWEDTMLEVIADNRMPPWNANPAYGHFANDARLSEEEIAKLRTWVENGMPEGDPDDLPPKPVFTEGWKIPEPDVVLPMREKAFTVPAQGIVDYQRFVVEPGWEEDKFIYAAEARPQNRSVVHHILVYIIPPGAKRMNLRNVLVGYAPGSLPIHYQDGHAIKVPAGSKLLFELHYTPNGTQQTDLSYAGICFLDEDKVRRTVEGQIAIRHDFLIPPNHPNFEVQAEYRSRQRELLLAMTPHMHLRGKSFRYEAVYPGGESEILLDVPNYDFNWQLKYILEEPKELPKGTRILCTAVYDNSEKNLVNPDPNRSVGWGDQSWDEMMIGFMDTIPLGD